MNEETPPVDSRAIPSMRIFVFCDGTAQNAVRNKEVTEDTNVQRFKQCVPVSGSVHHIYESGIGTHAPENAGMLSLSSLGNISCQVTGSGEWAPILASHGYEDRINLGTVSNR